uniref:Uncharacterized protein n=1 Tax=Climaconeis cf. scalaris TaxID=2846828 RepID=A0A8F8SP55_9STRA|nr:hypothetical protein [Climaconeis cf. scalaris]
MNNITLEDFGLFKDESLNVDFVSFNGRNLDTPQMLEVARYFQTLGFNSYTKSREEEHSRQKYITNFRNKFELVFISNIPYQKKVKQIQFPGVSRHRFYELMKKKSIRGEKITQFNLVLACLDIYYDRLNKLNDECDSHEFVTKSSEIYNKLNKDKKRIINSRVIQNGKGLLFRFGNRRNAHYYRLYGKDNSLKFEFEIEGSFINDLNELLIKECFPEFETILSYQFFKQSLKLFKFYTYSPELIWGINPFLRHL